MGEGSEIYFLSNDVLELLPGNVIRKTINAWFIAGVAVGVVIDTIKES